MRPEVGEIKESYRVSEAAHLLSHPGQSALASNSRAASQADRSHSSWLQPGGRLRRIHPGSALRLYRSLKAPLRQTFESESAVPTKPGVNTR